MDKSLNQKSKTLIIFKSITSHQFFFPIFLLFIMLISYGILIPWLSFYGDDWALIWNSYRIFNQDWISFRPIVILYYQILSTFLQPVFYQWFIIAILFRWVGGIALYLFFRELLPNYKKDAEEFTLLYALYPGFILYSPVTNIAPFTQPFFLLISFYLMIRWIKSKNHNWFLLFLSMLTAGINLITTEYFIFLELLRPLLIWFVSKNDEANNKFIKMIKTWIPYGIILMVTLIWRIFLQTKSPYDAKIIELIKQPIETLQKVFHDFQTVILQPLLASFQPSTTLGPRTQIIYFGLMILIGVLVFIYLISHFFLGTVDENSTKKEPKPYIFLGVGFLVFLMAGLPFWIANLQVEYGSNGLNRFAVTQALGFTLIIFTVVVLIKQRSKFFAVLTISLLAGLFSGIQFKAANDFREIWANQEQFFWDLSWRVPKLEPGTVIIMNSSGIGDNALSTLLNWNYVKQIRATKLDYYVYQDVNHLKVEVPNYKDNQIISNGHVGGNFEGNTNRTLIIHFEPTSCLRVLDPEIDKYNPDITDFTHEYIQFSNSTVIQANNYLDSGALDPLIFRKELSHGWCYYFEKADLARQLEDWKAIAELGKKAFTLGEHPNIAELLPFIEGYAHLGDWEKALKLSKDIIQISSEYRNMTCALWQRINKTTSDNEVKKTTLEWLTLNVECSFNK